MNKSCIRQTNITDYLTSTHLKQTNLYSTPNKNELSQSIEIVLFPRKSKDMLTHNIEEGGIAVNMQSNLRPPKKSSSFKKSSKLQRVNNSIVLKPKNMIFPRLHSLDASPQDKKMIIERSKTSKRSIHLRRILSYGQSVRADKKTKANLHGSNEDYNESELQKIGTQNIFLLARPKNKSINTLNESFQLQEQMKQRKFKRFDAPMFREESSKKFMPNNPKRRGSDFSNIYFG